MQWILVRPNTENPRFLDETKRKSLLLYMLTIKWKQICFTFLRSWRVRLIEFLLQYQFQGWRFRWIWLELMTFHFVSPYIHVTRFILTLHGSPLCVFGYFRLFINIQKLITIYLDSKTSFKFSKHNSMSSIWCFNWIFVEFID